MPARAPRILILRKEVKRRTAILSDTTLWAWTSAGTFPQPVHLNPGAKCPRLAWYEDEIDAWIAARPRGTGNGPSEEVYAQRTAKAEARLVADNKPASPPDDGRSSSAAPPPAEAEARLTRPCKSANSPDGSREPATAPPPADRSAGATAPAPRPVLLSPKARRARRQAT